MKPGFGAKKNKKKNKGKKEKKDKNAAAGGMDCDDGPVGDPNGPQPDYTIPKDTSVTAELSAKDRQKGRMALKAQLKVKVAGLKKARAKLTKVPGNKVQRKEVSEAKQEALSELAELQKDKTAKKKNKKKNKKGGQAAAAGAGGGDAMDE
ncbi:hypothetical protein HYH02_004052 [Chlamydomonas schloesseri]|uniref:Uncharacterized protein n=1 Tax=Chlamydomonas schloesseri TaxID=2026947 RepID=A0A835WP56_9CHLO|nr:hypothetical protein HYH02_004052 [Chlamydomonas schloesseri]|eukprot:KAG2451454.1 hypothetical protein HYH02_004052 [Chlamydomonas schloesseri]